MNDTTNSAVAAAKLLVGDEGGECQMHNINLAIEHAFGKRKRTVMGQVMDDFAPGEEVMNADEGLIRT